MAHNVTHKKEVIILSNLSKQLKGIRLSVRVSDEMFEALNSTAKRLKCDVSQVIRHAVKKQVIEKRPSDNDSELWG